MKATFYELSRGLARINGKSISGLLKKNNEFRPFTRKNVSYNIKQFFPLQRRSDGENHHGQNIIISATHWNKTQDFPNPLQNYNNLCSHSKGKLFYI